MRVKRQAEDNRDLEQVQIRAFEIQLGAAENPELGKVLSKWNTLTGGIWLPLSPHLQKAREELERENAKKKEKEK